MREVQDPPLTYSDRLRLALFTCIALLLVFLSACNLQPPPQSPAAAGSGLFGHPVNPDPSIVYESQKALIGAIDAHYADLRLNETMWKPCEGELNSWYDPERRRIELCTEMAQYPSPALFYAAHEAAHAVTWQLAGTLDEADADTVATLEMVRLGLTKQMRETADWYRSRDNKLHYRYEGHPGYPFRAWLLQCMADGSEQLDTECSQLYEGQKLYWQIRLAQPQTPDLSE